MRGGVSSTETMKAIIVLSASESKRLIAKGITKLPEIQRAYREGIIGLPLCTTNAYIYEELSGKSIDNPASYCCGYIYDKGFCNVNFEDMHPEVVYIRSEEIHLNFPSQNLSSYIEQMTPKDVVLKSGNILDINKKAGLLVGQPYGGEFGKIMPYILSKGIQLIVPMTLNKTTPIVLDNILPELGVDVISREFCCGVTVGMLPLQGKVFTEIEAFDVLVGVTAYPISMSGVDSGEGSVTILLKGEKEKIISAWKLVNSIKGEPPIKRIPFCKVCSVTEKEKTCVFKSNVFQDM